MPAESFLGVQACRLAGLKGVNPAQRLHAACKSVAMALFLGVSSLPFGRPERFHCCAAAPHNLHKCCRGHQLWRQILFLGVSSLPFGSLKGVNPAQRLLQLAKAMPWPFSWGFKLACGRQDSCKLCAAAPHLAKVLPWPPTVPAESFLGGSSLPFGRPERCKPCAAAPHNLRNRCRGHQLCRQSLFLGVQVCRLAGLKGVNPAQRLHAACKSVAVALFWGIQACLWQA